MDIINRLSNNKSAHTQVGCLFKNRSKLASINKKKSYHKKMKPLDSNYIRWFHETKPEKIPRP